MTPGRIARADAVLTPAINDAISHPIDTALGRRPGGGLLGAIQNQDNQTKFDQEMKETADANARIKQVNDETGFGKGLLHTAQQVTNSPLSAASLIPHPVARMIGAGLSSQDVYNRSYLEARMKVCQ